MALPPLRRLVTRIAFEVTGEEAANRAVDALSAKMRRNSTTAQNASDAKARREERAAERELTRLHRDEARREASERRAIAMRERAERAEQRRQAADERRAAAEQRRQDAAANRETAARERSINAQLKLLDRQSREQARIDRQKDSEEKRAAAQAARLAAAQRREQLARERADSAGVDSAIRAQRRIEREQAAALRRKLAEERRYQAVLARQARNAQRQRERAERQQLAAQRAIERQQERLARESARQVASAEAAKRREIRETAAEQRRANREAREAGHLIGHFGAALGLLYTGHELIHMADEWSFITATVKNSTQSVGDFQDAMKSLFALSQNAGVGVEAPLRLFNQLSANRQENHLSQADILTMTDTVTRGIALNHGTGAQNLRAMRQFDEMLSQGRLSRQHMNSLRVDNPYLANLMARVAGGQQHLDQAIHSRQADMPYIIRLMRDMRKEVDHDWGNVQTTFSMAYQRIRNTAMRVMGELIIDNHTLSVALNVVTAGVDKLADGIDRAAHAVGGFSQLTHIAGIALAAAFGPVAISSLIAFGTALAPLILPWAAMAAGIAAVLLALDDLYAWVEGRPSVVGIVLGDFNQYRAQLLKLRDAILHAFGMDHILDNVHSVGDAFRNLLDYFNALSKDPTTHWRLVQQVSDALTKLTRIAEIVGTVVDFAHKVDQYDPTQMIFRGIMNHLPDRSTMQRAENALGSFGARPLYNTTGTTNQHFEMPITVVTQPGANSREIADAVASRIPGAVNTAGRQSGPRNNLFPTAFPVAEAGAVRQ